MCVCSSDCWITWCVTTAQSAGGLCSHLYCVQLWSAHTSWVKLKTTSPTPWSWWAEVHNMNLFSTHFSQSDLQMSEDTDSEEMSLSLTCVCLASVLPEEQKSRIEKNLIKVLMVCMECTQFPSDFHYNLTWRSLNLWWTRPLAWNEATDLTCATRIRNVKIYNSVGRNTLVKIFNWPLFALTHSFIIFLCLFLWEFPQKHFYISSFLLW